MIIQRAETKAELDQIRSLFREYEASLDVDLGFQDFERELNTLPGKYAPPEGDLLIGSIQGAPLGCVAVRRLQDRICEMKRLYVRPQGRGTGLGKLLARQIIAVARELGYSSMRLDTLSSLNAAMRLYESLGFQRIEPYYDNPLPDVVYWELNFAKLSATTQQGVAPNAYPLRG